MILEIIDGDNRPIKIQLEDFLFDTVTNALKSNQSIFINDEKGGQYIQIGIELINRSFIRIIR